VQKREMRMMTLQCWLQRSNRICSRPDKNKARRSRNIDWQCCKVWLVSRRPGSGASFLWGKRWLASRKCSYAPKGENLCFNLVGSRTRAARYANWNWLHRVRCSRLTIRKNYELLCSEMRLKWKSGRKKWI
jgi:hypothetical protein